MSGRIGTGTLALGLGLLAVGCSSGGSGGGVIPPPASVTLLEVQTQVFAPTCAITDCHTGPTAPHGLDLSSVVTSEANLIGVASAEVPGLLRVEPGNPTDSYLYMKLVDDPRILGDPMPATGPPLSASSLSLVESWIEDGAP